MRGRVASWTGPTARQARRDEAEIILSPTAGSQAWAAAGPLVAEAVEHLQHLAPRRELPPAGPLVRLDGPQELQLRRRRRDVLIDLPPKLQSTVSIVLGSQQRRAYQRALDEGRVRIARLGRDLRITHVLELLLRLKQICNFCPESGESAKLDDLRERLAAMIEAREKGLVFSQFVESTWGIRRLEQELRALSPLAIVGGLDDAIARTQQWMLSQQHATGYWCGELEGDTILESEYILLLAWLGKGQSEVARKCANYILEQQMPEGGWAMFPGGELERTLLVPPASARRAGSVHCRRAQSRR